MLYKSHQIYFIIKNTIFLPEMQSKHKFQLWNINPLHRAKLT